MEQIGSFCALASGLLLLLLPVAVSRAMAVIRGSSDRLAATTAKVGWLVVRRHSSRVTLGFPPAATADERVTGADGRETST